MSDIKSKLSERYKELAAQIGDSRLRIKSIKTHISKLEEEIAKLNDASIIFDALERESKEKAASDEK